MTRTHFKSRVRVLMLAGLAVGMMDRPLAAVVADRTQAGILPTIAPNTAAKAIRAAESAVVKLYGGKIGRVHGYGTGFLISSDGRILTTKSLLLSGQSLRAVLSDGRRFEAVVKRVDEGRQLAELKIEAENLPFISVESSTTIEPGDSIIAMGNWFRVADGNEPVSVTRGILSMRTTLDANRLAQEFDYRGPVLVYDAITANPGAPGGPLLDIEGRCVGMIGVIVEASATNTRLNYALPSEELLAFLGGDAAQPTTLPSMDPKGGREPFLGIKLSRLGFRQVTAYVERVADGSPAAEAGVKKDDLILSVNGKRIADAGDFDALVLRLTPGQPVQIVVKRGSQLLRIDFVVGAKE
ncbi:MAG: serine protease [Phycisphaerae bacterium]|nr:serine protease [Phycisphaerae bacterium]